MKNAPSRFPCPQGESIGLYTTKISPCGGRIAINPKRKIRVFKYLFINSGPLVKF
jgi:hypothetical protein